ncbi:cyclin-D5-1 isoform X2 [Arachis ipaensis]|uniref:cyclin-D5-1 isoform X2 n=1 Tax=Arachis ipaensis TaxID=130454 RepID=UPI000A2B4315|nr:cyclin-D5-1 isoform X2 [Arachis ipaensis]QHN94472.1 Cyclin [Arachis hypogaea]
MKNRTRNMDDLSSCNLLCEEEETFLELERDEEYSAFQSGMDHQGVSENEDLGVLLEREIRIGFRKDETFVFEDWMKRSRTDAINWILKSEKEWAIRLLSIACLSLASKMEECSVPELSVFQSKDYCFESKVIRRMEILVLTTLDWNMSIITPYDFLPYFITKFCNQPPPTTTFSKTMQLIFTTIKEVSIMDHKPSVVAAAATLVSLDQQLTIEAVELKISSIPQHRFLDPKDVFSCYNLIQRLQEENNTRRDNNVLHTPSPSTIDMIESSLITSSAAVTKRRRLSFNDDQSSEGKGLD